MIKLRLVHAPGIIYIPSPRMSAYLGIVLRRASATKFNSNALTMNSNMILFRRARRVTFLACFVKLSRLVPRLPVSTSRRSRYFLTLNAFPNPILFPKVRWLRIVVTAYVRVVRSIAPMNKFLQGIPTARGRQRMYTRRSFAVISSPLHRSSDARCLVSFARYISKYVTLCHRSR